MLTSIEVENFRCIQSAHLEFDVRATGIVGRNASGKTSLLEAIYFLAHGKSFRSGRRDELIGVGSEQLRVVGRVFDGEAATLIGAEFGAQGGRLHVGGEVAHGFAEAAALLPIQVIEPGVHRIIEEGSAKRRRLLDWGVFHVEPRFIAAWRRYQRALAQRNAALKSVQPERMARIWDAELVASAESIDAARSGYFQRLAAEFRPWASELVGTEVGIDYQRGWRRGESLEEALATSWPRDQRIKTTSVGAHRADLIFRIEGVSARERISRGQQKMLASALLLSLCALRAEHTSSTATLLLDDPAAELDVDNLGKLLEAVLRLPLQLIVTAVSTSALRGLPLGRTFHVEHGRVGYNFAP